MRIPLFGSVGSARPCGVTRYLHLRCALRPFLCVRGPPSCADASREVVFGVPEDFPGLLSALLLLQVTDVWEEGECGELLIVQSLLVPRESHKVSEGRHGMLGRVKGGSPSPTHLHPCCDPLSLSLGKSHVPNTGCSVATHTFLHLPHGLMLEFPSLLLCLPCSPGQWKGEFDDVLSGF